MEIKVYIRSTIDRTGGCTRLIRQEPAANRVSTITSLHYDFIKHADTVPRFRIAGVWSNPHGLPENSSQDLKKLFPNFLEGLLMIYLGTYDRVNRCTVANLGPLFPDASYTLVQKIRNSLELPQFRSASLNRAWPLIQGVHGGMVVATRCANEECGRIKVRQVKPEEGFTTTARFIAIDSPFSPRCAGAFWMSSGTSSLDRLGMMIGVSILITNDEEMPANMTVPVPPKEMF